jgi:hypothetical protein
VAQMVTGHPEPKREKRAPPSPPFFLFPKL